MNIILCRIRSAELDTTVLEFFLSWKIKQTNHLTHLNISMTKAFIGNSNVPNLSAQLKVKTLLKRVVCLQANRGAPV